MDITVAIVCSTDNRLSRCIASVEKGTPILVVLNYPSESVLAMVSAEPRVESIRIDDRNLGRLRQAAVDEVKTPGIVFIDSDCEFEPDTLREVSRLLDSFCAVSIPLRFRHDSVASHVVSKCRRFTTPDDALLMPVAFRTAIQRKIGGYLYDSRLAWGEDSDQRPRLAQAGIPFVVSRGVIWHRSLGVWEDALSAKRLGWGAHIRVARSVAASRSLFQDLSIMHEVQLALDCWRKCGLWAATYHLLVWRPAFKIGYWQAALRKPNPEEGSQ